MIPMELKVSVSYKLLVVCVSTADKEPDQLTKTFKTCIGLHETLTPFLFVYCVLLR